MRAVLLLMLADLIQCSHCSARQRADGRRWPDGDLSHNAAYNNNCSSMVGASWSQARLGLAAANSRDREVNYSIDCWLATRSRPAGGCRTYLIFYYATQVGPRSCRVMVRDDVIYPLSKNRGRSQIAYYDDRILRCNETDCSSNITSKKRNDATPRGGLLNIVQDKKTRHFVYLG